MRLYIDSNLFKFVEHWNEDNRRIVASFAFKALGSFSSKEDILQDLLVRLVEEYEQKKEMLEISHIPLIFKSELSKKYGKKRSVAKKEDLMSYREDTQLSADYLLSAGDSVIVEDYRLEVTKDKTDSKQLLDLVITDKIINHLKENLTETEFTAYYLFLSTEENHKKIAKDFNFTKSQWFTIRKKALNLAKEIVNEYEE